MHNKDFHNRNPSVTYVSAPVTTRTPPSNLMPLRSVFADLPVMVAKDFANFSQRGSKDFTMKHLIWNSWHSTSSWIFNLHLHFPEFHKKNIRENISVKFCAFKMQKISWKVIIGKLAVQKNCKDKIREGKIFIRCDMGCIFSLKIIFPSLSPIFWNIFTPEFKYVSAYCKSLLLSIFSFFHPTSPNSSKMISPPPW